MSNKQPELNNSLMIALFFDTGKIDDVFYGAIIFNQLICGKEIANNQYRTIVSVGDILHPSVYDDLNPFLVKDGLCTVNKRITNNSEIYAVLIEDIEKVTATKIDERLQRSFSAYIGFSTVDIESTDERKQFWKQLIRSYSIENTSITFFSDEELLIYKKTAIENGFTVSFDGLIYDYEENDGNKLHPSKYSSYIKLQEQLEYVDGSNDADRGLMEMNFALVREVGLAGVQIWKAIEDIERICLIRNYMEPTDYVFTSLYFAAQGTERLLKVILELINYIDRKSDEKINDLLYSHNHIAMIDYIKKQYQVDLNKNCIRLLNTLNIFYTKARYGRYKYSGNNTLELQLLSDFGNKIPDENYNEDIKNLYGKTLGMISQSLYHLIIDLSSTLNVYVYELDYNSVANFVFSSVYGDNLYKTLKFVELSKKELLLFLIKSGNNLRISEYLGDLEPLSFEEFDVNLLINELITNKSYNSLLNDFVTESHNDIREKDKQKYKSRIDLIDDVIGNINLWFDDEF